MRKIFRHIFILILMIGLVFLIQGVFRSYQKVKVAKESQTLSQLVDKIKIKEEIQGNISQKDRDMVLSREIIDIYKKKYKSDNIAGVIEVGNGLIREPAIVDPEMNYLRKLPNGEYALEGTVIIHGGDQKSSADNYAAYYGHGMKNGSRFGPLLDYKEGLDKLKMARVYTDQGIKNLQLLSFSIIDIDFFQSIPITGYEEIKTYLEDVDKIGQLIYTSNEEVGEDDFIATLSTCAVYGGKERIVAIYKEEEI